MIKNLVRGLAALSLTLAPLTATPPAQARAPEPTVLPIGVAISALPLDTESRDGYTRSAFRHWNAGANPSDGCNTRNEVLISEADTAPTIGPRCTLTGGSWSSYYDEQMVTSASRLDIDHMVPLAEAWDSGASGWDAKRREQYANDLGSERSLVAVTAKTNRSKSDKDPSQWLPPAASAQCTYGADWVATKLRWKLTADDAERTALEALAAGCAGTTVTYEAAP
ncbi:HNH endonuclease family protein [Streptomyces atratus]|uniref:HNH endonuclease family protein n=1 Tax=Streptomyces atratus TaxID=1893 RepID=UPI0036912C62